MNEHRFQEGDRVRVNDRSLSANRGRLGTIRRIPAKGVVDVHLDGDEAPIALRWHKLDLAAPLDITQAFLGWWFAQPRAIRVVAEPAPITLTLTHAQAMKMRGLIAAYDHSGELTSAYEDLLEATDA